MPFIIYSIGVDNVFILLAAWRKAPPIHDNVRSRLAATFADAGVSITVRTLLLENFSTADSMQVTSLTDSLSFGVGTLAHFPSVRIFCVYAAVAILFVYIYQLTFFAGAFR